MGGINLIKSLIIQLEDFHLKKHLSCWAAQIAARGGSCRSRDSAYKLILLICNKLHVTKNLNWIKCNSTRSNRYYRKSSIADSFIKSLPCDFFTNHLNPKSPYFNLCASWNVNGWNSEKKDGVSCFISKFKPVFLCLQEIGNSKYLCNNDHNSFN